MLEYSKKVVWFG